jgi:hypothetical protein
MLVVIDSKEFDKLRSRIETLLEYHDGLTPIEDAKNETIEVILDDLDYFWKKATE